MEEKAEGVSFDTPLEEALARRSEELLTARSELQVLRHDHARLKEAMKALVDAL